MYPTTKNEIQIICFSFSIVLGIIYLFYLLHSIYYEDSNTNSRKTTITKVFENIISMFKTSSGIYTLLSVLLITYLYRMQYLGNLSFDDKPESFLILIFTIISSFPLVFLIITISSLRKTLSGWEILYYFFSKDLRWIIFRTYHDIALSRVSCKKFLFSVITIIFYKLIILFLISKCQINPELISSGFNSFIYLILYYIFAENDLLINGTNKVFMWSNSNYGFNSGQPSGGSNNSGGPSPNNIPLFPDSSNDNSSEGSFERYNRHSYCFNYCEQSLNIIQRVATTANYSLQYMVTSLIQNNISCSDLYKPRYTEQDNLDLYSDRIKYNGTRPNPDPHINFLVVTMLEQIINRFSNDTPILSIGYGNNMKLIYKDIMLNYGDLRPKISIFQDKLVRECIKLNPRYYSNYVGTEVRTLRGATGPRPKLTIGNDIIIFNNTNKGFGFINLLQALGLNKVHTNISSAPLESREAMMNGYIQERFLQVMHGGLHSNKILEDLIVIHFNHSVIAPMEYMSNSEVYLNNLTIDIRNRNMFLQNENRTTQEPLNNCLEYFFVQPNSGYCKKGLELINSCSNPNYKREYWLQRFRNAGITCNTLHETRPLSSDTNTFKLPQHNYEPYFASDNQEIRNLINKLHNYIYNRFKKDIPAINIDPNNRISVHYPQREVCYKDIVEDNLYNERELFVLEKCVLWNKTRFKYITEFYPTLQDEVVLFDTEKRGYRFSNILQKVDTSRFKVLTNNPFES